MNLLFFSVEKNVFLHRKKEHSRGGGKGKKRFYLVPIFFSFFFFFFLFNVEKLFPHLVPNMDKNYCPSVVVISLPGTGIVSK